MNWEKGYYTIPCKINGLSSSCIYDVNMASAISVSYAIFMAKNGYLNEQDVLDYNMPKTLRENTEVIIREIEIGGMKMHSIKARVVQDMVVPLVLGQSALQQLGSAQITGNELIVIPFSAYNQNTYQQRNQNQYRQTYPVQQAYQQSAYSPVQQEQSRQVYQQQSYQPVQQQTCPIPSGRQKEIQTIIVYIDNEVELAFNDNIQCNDNNPNICQVWIRREYFGEYKNKYISSFTKANINYLEEQKKANKNFDATRHHVNYTNFKYNWALYLFDFSQQRYRMINLTQYDRNNKVIQVSDNVKSTWENPKPDSRMKIMYDAIYSYVK